jgi:hypothetical protein
VLGDRLIHLMLDLVEGLIEASHRRDKRSVLDAVSVKLDRLRFLIRLSKDLKLLTLSRYEFGARAVNEVGTAVAAEDGTLQRGRPAGERGLGAPGFQPFDPGFEGGQL